MSIHESLEAALAPFPQQVSLDNGREFELRPATQADKDAILDFARGLHEKDLLFLRVDITQPAVVTNWLNNVTVGETVSILAMDGDNVAGYATVDRNSARWTRRVGEIRVNVAPDLRSHGLGRHLIAKIFDVARLLGLKKLVANMTPDQTGAQTAFTHLGFRTEALLTDFVEDRKGDVHDLIYMSYDIDGHTNLADDPLSLAL